MTEAEWLGCEDPEAMLGFLRTGAKLTRRKGGLFGVAVCHLIGHLLTDGRSRRAVEVAERYADGEAAPGELDAAYDAAFDVAAALAEGAGPDALRCAAWVASIAAHPEYTREGIVLEAAQAVGTTDEWTAEADLLRSLHGNPFRAQADLLRCIFGKPFRLASFDSAGLSWKQRTIPKLAHDVYEDRELPSGHLDKVRLGILADALEDAGCSDAVLLEHLRGQRPHVRGCFAPDAILGKV
jgi:hypothetical protein